MWSTAAMRLDERLDRQPNLELDRRRAAGTARAIPGSISTRCNEFSDYWATVRSFYAPSTRDSDSGRPKSISTRCPAASTPIFKEQAVRWASGSLARSRARLCRGEPALRRHREGHAVQKVVGDMALMMVTNNLSAEDVLDPIRADHLPQVGRGTVQGRHWPAGRRLST